MKLFVVLFLGLFMVAAFARDCKVYGISDSPQSLRCSFKELDIKLSCKDGSYYLNSSRVLQAFHMDVEEGPSPLVFRSSSLQLTVIMNSRTDILGELEQSGIFSFGPCRR